MRVIIAGGRNFNDFKLLAQECDRELVNGQALDLEFICGMAKGADLLGKRYAEYWGYPVKCFPADWDSCGKSAGYRRNIEMAKYAQEENGMLIAFWDGESKGTKHMIDLANKHQLKVRVIRY